MRTRLTTSFTRLAHGRYRGGRGLVLLWPMGTTRASGGWLKFKNETMLVL